jgi:hypothetical protein
MQSVTYKSLMLSVIMLNVVAPSRYPVAIAMVLICVFAGKIANVNIALDISVSGLACKEGQVFNFRIGCFTAKHAISAQDTCGLV